MIKLSLILLYVLVVLVIADLLAGTVHWAEDAYVREDTPVIGKLLGVPNTIHHHLPRHMTRNTWWQSSWDLALLSGLVVLVAWLLGVLTWQVWLFAVVSANANEVHKWAHRTRKENRPFITFPWPGNLWSVICDGSIDQEAGGEYPFALAHVPNYLENRPRNLSREAAFPWLQIPQTASSQHSIALDAVPPGHRWQWKPIHFHFDWFKNP